MENRVFGWVQNPSSFKSLQHVVQIFDAESTQYADLRDRLVSAYIPIKSIKDSLQSKLNQGKTTFSYLELVGRKIDATGNTKIDRSDAVGNSLIQITIPSQSAATREKYWTDDWTSDGFLRWAVSLNFVSYSRETDQCSITPKGLKFSREKTEEGIKEILIEAFLRYPPACRVLSVLNSNDHPLNKFEIGHNLGFSGESGFTSYSSTIMTELLKQEGDREKIKKIRNVIEGTADKYARMISGWLSKVGLVDIISRTSVENEHLGKITGFQEYRITAQGVHRFMQAQGSSKNKKLPKFVMWEFFSTTGTDRAYVRTRRASILNLLMRSSSKTWNSLLADLKQSGFDDQPAIIKNDIEGLKNSGIRIDTEGDKVKLRDSIESFDIPQEHQRGRKPIDIERSAEKAEFLERTNLPVRFLELLSIAYNGKQNQAFEIITAELFHDVYGLGALHLGGSKKPDALVFSNNFGIIVDTKAYSQGYSKSISQEDEMVRYIEDNQQRSSSRNPNEWWLSFPPEISGDAFYFLWISSYFTGRFDDQLEETYHRTGVKGGALNVRELLEGAHLIQEKQMNPSDLPQYMNNGQIQFSE
jgi:hypothetical protein